MGGIKMKIYLIVFSLVFVILTIPGFGQIVSISDSDSLLAEDYVFRSKPNIAVLPFYDANAQAKEVEFGRTVSAMLATALRSNTNFVVLERGEINQILTEQAVSISGITREMSRSFNELYNVEVLLSGDVSLINSTLHIDARLIETSSSKIVVALYSTCQDLRNIREVVVRLARELEQTYLRQWIGSVSIISDPAGAEVYLDESYIGMTTIDEPLAIKDLLEGNYALKFIRGGYYDWEGEISVLSKMERFVKVSLIAKPGAMNIYTEPAGAEIYLDNNMMGVTPLSLKKVAEGEHEIRLIKENYKEWTQMVMVRSFQPTDVKATLEVSPGTLTINSIPSGAAINFKGNLVAQTPHTLSNITPGEVVVNVEKENYEPWTTSVYISPNSHKTLDIVLTEKKGNFTISSTPAQASVYIVDISGKQRTFIGTTPILNYEVAIGEYTIQIEKENYFSESKKINIKHNQLSDVGVELEEKPGAILVNTTPENARIYLNDIFKGRSPLYLEKIPKGTYKFHLGLPYAEKEQIITIQPNQQTNINNSLKKSQNYLIPATAMGAIILALSLAAR
jgi:TolB-like protein